MSLKSAFPPSVDTAARVLILGSLPGDESIRRGEYYAHPTNAFWWLVGEVIGAPLKTLPYEERMAAIAAHHIGVWDVIEVAQRPGSLDAAIRDPIPRDLARFVAALPALRAVAFNGGTAARHGRKQLCGVEHLALIDLPSSSAAHAGMRPDAKRTAWLKLRAYL